MGTPSATVYVDYKGTPHAFIKLDDGNGNIQYYGFAPAESGSAGILSPTPGKVGLGATTHERGVDTHNEYAGYMDDVCWSKTIPLSTGQLAAMTSTAEAWHQTPPTYNVIGNNCTAFVKAVLQSGNASYPGIGTGPSPFNLVPGYEQGPLYNTDIYGMRSFSDAVTDPLNTLGTPAYQDRIEHPERYPVTGTPVATDRVSYRYEQTSNVNGTAAVSVVQQITSTLSEVATDYNGDGNLDSRRLVYADGTVNNLASLQDVQQAEYELSALRKSEVLDIGSYNDFTNWSSHFLLTSGINVCPADVALSLDPIGAFYESRTAASDPALAIADKTPVILDSFSRGMTAASLGALDANHDGELAGAELDGLCIWTDANENADAKENGVAEAGELKTLALAGIGAISSADYAFYTAGNANYVNGAFPAAPAAPASNYRVLRDTDNDFYYGGVRFTWDSRYMKIPNSHPEALVGTDGNDGIDPVVLQLGFTNAGMGNWFNFDALTNILAGDGNDTVWGSSRSENIWGGTGEDVLWSNAGADKLYGEEGNDKLLGGDGNDTIDGGVGDDMAWGGTGDDKLYGGDGKDQLLGEDGNDILDGGTGDDIAWGEAGNDTLYGGDGGDELQGGAGNDALYGQAGNDLLFGQVGDDTLYGGAGEDVLVGFMGSNESKQTLDAGESDNDHLYGGAGNDILLGGLGNDYLDGGAGADIMQGGAGDDVYIVNSVNDDVLELPGNENGYDTVISSVNYLLNSSVEELRLLEGYDINGTGNARDNKLVGNSRDNVLDGVSGKDMMIGGAGNDTYYVDDTGDQVVELAGEGTDTVQSKIGYTLGANVENLVLLDFSKPEKGLADGKSILVYGYPKANELDYMQGDAIDNYWGTCALTSLANLLTQVNVPTTEGQVVQLAINNNWAITDPTKPAYQRGGSNYWQQQQILKNYGIRNDLLSGYNVAGVANLIRSGRGVVIALNAGKLWDDAAYTDNVGVNHVVTLTGVSYGESDGTLMGFYVADSGRHIVSDMTRYVPIDKFREAADVAGAYAIYTLEPLKLWNENFDGHGNELNNLIVGNRGDNLLSGEAGNDTIEGGDGNDTLIGGAGNDHLSGGAGDDTYVGVETADTVTELAGSGSDTVIVSYSFDLAASPNVENVTLTGNANSNATGSGADNRLTGNAGNNVLTGLDGNDILDGGAGTDTLNGGAGDDTYVFGRGYGVDTINDIGASVPVWVSSGYTVDGGWVWDDGMGEDVWVNSYYVDTSHWETQTTDGGVDTLRFGSNIVLNDLQVSSNGILIGLRTTPTTGVEPPLMDDVAGAMADHIFVNVSLWDPKSRIEFVEFADGTRYSTANWVAGSDGRNDGLCATDGGSWLWGGFGTDVLTGSASADRLDGGANDDTLLGGSGNDMYYFRRGGGADTIRDETATNTWVSTGGGGRWIWDDELYDYVWIEGSPSGYWSSQITDGGNDTLQFGAGIAADQLWFRHVGNDLEVDVIGTSDKVTIQNWYSGPANHIEQFKTDDGKLLVDTKVEQLVQAMAQFAPPAAGQTTLPSSYQSSLAPVIAANWH